ncbi:hypothetical protein DFH09DRAFT_1179718 [Mycena vulgaris]|nr:hypothetical protein DFH09DRAFT_1188467 [Mycena vulgaris]KAJ6535209.1 hypothetical protein DFH09DRAFT_1179718 [Mycena vulgaris]
MDNNQFSHLVSRSQRLVNPFPAEYSVHGSEFGRPIPAQLSTPWLVEFLNSLSPFPHHTLSDLHITLGRPRDLSSRICRHATWPSLFWGLLFAIHAYCSIPSLSGSSPFGGCLPVAAPRGFRPTSFLATSGAGAASPRSSQLIVTYMTSDFFVFVF